MCLCVFNQEFLLDRRGWFDRVTEGVVDGLLFVMVFLLCFQCEGAYVLGYVVVPSLC